MYYYRPLMDTPPVTPAALRLFCERIGISKADNNIDMSVLEDCSREYENEPLEVRDDKNIDMSVLEDCSREVDNNIDMSVLEHCSREVLEEDTLRAFAVLEEDALRAFAVLEEDALRAFAVLDPIKLTISNWPEGKVEEFEAEIHPKRPELGTRKIPFSGGQQILPKRPELGTRKIFSGTVMIDREDFSEDPPKGFFRLVPGGQ
ncbi:hypothetical protein T484DRAFT_1820131, partial [Baffinella frigidus]